MVAYTSAGSPSDGSAIVFCDGAFGTTYGKTAHGLVRFTRRYRVLAVIDRSHAGRDAAEVLDGRPAGIPVVATLDEALEVAREAGARATHFVIGIAPDGGVMDDRMRAAIRDAILHGLNVDSGLHDFVSDQVELAELARRYGVALRDVRKTPARSAMHAFSGKIKEVAATRIALLGTDSAIGKRTTAWILVHALNATRIRAQMIGTGQTAWMQGVEYGLIMDSLINDFVAGEIEHQIWRADREKRPDVIVIEGQGSLMNPAYPGGFEILAAGRPHGVVLQHAPTRLEYDGFPGYPMHPIDKQIHAIEFLSGKPVIAITINHERLGRERIPAVCEELSRATGLPVCDPIFDGVGPVVDAVRSLLRSAASDEPAGPSVPPARAD